MTFPHPDLTGTTSSTTNNTVAMGRGDDLDVAAGRCCPTCRHNLTDHNRQVWNAGYTIAQRHAKDDIANAWEEGFSAACDQHIAQRRDPSHPITRDNPYAGGASS